MRRTRIIDTDGKKEPTDMHRNIADTLAVLDFRRESRIQAKVLPPFHYGLNGKEPVFVLDELGATLVKLGLENEVTKSQDHERFYVFEEKVGSSNGKPTTVVKLYTSPVLEYTLVADDGTNRTIELRKEMCATAQLVVHNPIEVPSFVILFGGCIPVYDRVRKALFEFSERFPLADDCNYRDYMKKFFDADTWLILRNN